MSIVFGTDGWRGVIARDYTFENLTLVAHATARYVLKLKRKGASVVVGHDTRFLSREFAIETSRILAAYGITVHLTDTISTTPQVSFHTLKKRAQIGLCLLDHALKLLAAVRYFNDRKTSATEVHEISCRGFNNRWG